jgi:hypothetical protein
MIVCGGMLLSCVRATAAAGIANDGTSSSAARKYFIFIVQFLVCGRRILTARLRWMPAALEIVRGHREPPETGGRWRLALALLLFNSVPVTVSTIRRISFVCAQVRIEAE